MRDARRQTLDAKGVRIGEQVRYPEQMGDVERNLERSGLFREAPGKACEHSLHVLQLGSYRRNSLFVGHAQEDGDEQMRFQFRSRTQCDVDKPAELSIAEPAASLGDIRCDRDRRPPTLRNEPEQFRLGELFGDPVDAFDDDTTSLPNLEFPKVLHPPHISGKRWKWNAPANRNTFGVSNQPRFANLADPTDAFGVWRLASGVFSRPGTFHPPQSSLAFGVWRLASGVPLSPGGVHPPQTPLGSGVSRLASSVPSPSSMAKPS
jgi:hypothetical protein